MATQSIWLWSPLPKAVFYKGKNFLPGQQVPSLWKTPFSQKIQVHTHSQLSENKSHKSVSLTKMVANFTKSSFPYDGGLPLHLFFPKEDSLNKQEVTGLVCLQAKLTYLIQYCLKWFLTYKVDLTTVQQQNMSESVYLWHFYNTISHQDLWLRGSVPWSNLARKQTIDAIFSWG